MVSSPTLENFDISIDSNGVWHHRGVAFTRLELAKLFATILHRDEHGDYWLQTPVERGKITVADTPFIAVEMRMTVENGQQNIAFRTNLDHLIPLDAAHRLDIGDPASPHPVIKMEKGLSARLTPAIFYELVEKSTPGPQNPAIIGVWSHGIFHPLGTISAPD